jgi:hypothetical protein
MRKISVLFALLAACGLAQASGCPATESDLVGAWSRAGDSGFFEEFSLEGSDGERTFNSWLHQRPEFAGATWSLEDCHLVVVPKYGEFGPFRFKVMGLKHGKLRLLDDSDRDESIYMRLPDEP